MPSPLRVDHGVTDVDASTWLGFYRAYTPGTEGGSNVTTLMLKDSPQPDAYLRILPEYGGQSYNAGGYVGGAPELITEICLSSASYDLHKKLDLYERAGVQEYVAVLVHEKEIRWHRLAKKGYRLVSPEADQIWKSKVFPGLWLDGTALLAGDGMQLLATLQLGLKTPEHA